MLEWAPRFGSNLGRRLIPRYILLSFFTVSSLSLFAQNNERLPSDPSVIVGKLPNGLTYYIKHNKVPEERANLYLATRVGSLLEEENERGLAHFVEHMAFKGTKHFPKNELIDYLQRAGVRFGSDLNAFTSFENTVYILPIPTADVEVLENGVRILRDWAQDINFETEDIESERGVILEEKRQREGVHSKVVEAQMAMTTKGSIYPSRLPIGDEDVIRNFDPSIIRAFYDKWYRPDLQAVIAVGDFDVEWMENQIRTLFSDLQTPQDSPLRPDYPMELTGENGYAVFTDKEIPFTTINFLYKYYSHPFQTERDLLDGLNIGIFNNLASNRLGELLKQENSAIRSVRINIGAYLSNLGAASLTIIPKDGQDSLAIEQVYVELERIRKYGFTQAELDRAKYSFLRGQEATVSESENANSQVIATNLLNAYLNDTPFPTAAFEYHFYKEHIDEITTESVTRYVDQFFAKTNQDVFISAPKSMEMELPSASNLVSWIKNVQHLPIEKYEEVQLREELLVDMPKPGTIVEDTMFEELGVHQLVLSNGLKVILKPTDYKNDEILIDVYSRGGTALYEKDQFYNARYAASYVSASGIADLDATSVAKILTGRKLRITPFISTYEEGLKGYSSAQDLKTALELIYLYFTNPRIDEGVVQRGLNQAADGLRARYTQPARVYQDTVSQILNGYHWRYAPITAEHLNSVRSDQLLAIFKERFSNAADFTVLMTGSFSVEEAKLLLTKYLASLPGDDRREDFQDIGLNIPHQALRKIIYVGEEDKATVQVNINGDYSGSKFQGVYFTVLNNVLKNRVFQRLRSEESAVYSPHVNITRTISPRKTYSIAISFTTDPDKYAKLVEIVREELQSLATSGVFQDEIDKAKAELLAQHEVSVKTNGYWHSSLLTYIKYDFDFREILESLEIFQNINKETANQVATALIDVERLQEFVLLPKQMESPGSDSN